MARSCGSCSICCTNMEVPSVDSAAGVPCKHLSTCSSKACGIYDTRPDECATFKCLWLEGMFGNSKMRPDKSGILLSYTSSAFGPSVLANLIREGADKTTLGKQLLSTVRERLQGTGINLLLREAYKQTQTRR